MLKIGLTGGIGSGKTAVAKIFSSFNIPVIDTDIIAHQLTLPGSVCFKEITTLLGKEYITTNNELDRKRIAETIFEHPDKKKALEKILHPRIRERILEELKLHEESSYVILVIPLLFETDFINLVDRSLVVDAPEITRINRIKERDGISEELIKKILNNQLDQTERVKKADDILDNSNNIEDLQPAINSLHEIYLKLSGSV